MSFELTSLEDWQTNKMIIYSINKKNIQNECLQNIGSTIYSKDGFFKVLDILKNFEIIEMKDQIMKGILNSINILNLDYSQFIRVLKDSYVDLFSKEYLFYIFYLKQVFFEQTSKNNLDRILRTVKIQWALDIKKLHSKTR